MSFALLRAARARGGGRAIRREPDEGREGESGGSLQSTLSEFLGRGISRAVHKMLQENHPIPPR